MTISDDTMKEGNTYTDKERCISDLGLSQLLLQLLKTLMEVLSMVKTNITLGGYNGGLESK